MDTMGWNGVSEPPASSMFHGVGFRCRHMLDAGVGEGVVDDCIGYSPWHGGKTTPPAVSTVYAYSVRGGRPSYGPPSVAHIYTGGNKNLPP